MKIITEKESAILIDNIVKKHSDIDYIDVYSIWLKIKKYINCIVLVLSTTLGIWFSKIYGDGILSFFNIVQLNIPWRLFITLMGFIIILLLSILIVIVHELIHIVGLSIFKVPWLIVFSKQGLSILTLEWIRKKQEMLVLSLPVIVILIITFIIGLVSKNIFLFAWITLINLALSSSDIVNFIIILLKVPKNSLILGHYYRRQQ